MGSEDNGLTTSPSESKESLGIYGIFDYHTAALQNFESIPRLHEPPRQDHVFQLVAHMATHQNRSWIWLSLIMSSVSLIFISLTRFLH